MNYDIEVKVLMQISIESSNKQGDRDRSCKEPLIRKMMVNFTYTSD